MIAREGHLLLLPNRVVYDHAAGLHLRDVSTDAVRADTAEDGLSGGIADKLIKSESARKFQSLIFEALQIETECPRLLRMFLHEAATAERTPPLKIVEKPCHNCHRSPYAGHIDQGRRK